VTITRVTAQNCVGGDTTDDRGAYRAVAFLRPHFQLDELGVAMRLVAELPQPAA